MRGIAQQRQAAERPARQRIAVDHRIGQDQIGVAHHRGDVEPVERPVLVIADSSLPVPRLAPVDRRGDVALDLADPVDELVAGVVDVVADRIDDQRAMPRPDTRDAAAGEERLHPCRAAPQVDAAEHRCAFVRIELQAHRGMDAVAGHQDIAALRRQCRAIGTGEARRDAARRPARPPHSGGR